MFSRNRPSPPSLREGKDVLNWIENAFNLLKKCSFSFLSSVPGCCLSWHEEVLQNFRQVLRSPSVPNLPLSDAEEKVTVVLLASVVQPTNQPTAVRVVIPEQQMEGEGVTVFLRLERWLRWSFEWAKERILSVGTYEVEWGRAWRIIVHFHYFNWWELYCSGDLIMLSIYRGRGKTSRNIRASLMITDELLTTVKSPKSA